MELIFNSNDKIDWLIIFPVMVIIAVAAFSYAFYKKVKIISLCANEERYDNPGERIKNFVVEVLGQRKMLKEPYGVVHSIIFWGFILIVLGELPLIFEGLFPLIIAFLSWERIPTSI